MNVQQLNSSNYFNNSNWKYFHDHDGPKRVNQWIKRATKVIDHVAWWPSIVWKWPPDNCIPSIDSAPTKLCRSSWKLTRLLAADGSPSDLRSHTSHQRHLLILSCSKEAGRRTLQQIEFYSKEIVSSVSTAIEWCAFSWNWLLIKLNIIDSTIVGPIKLKIDLHDLSMRSSPLIASLW